MHVCVCPNAFRTECQEGLLLLSSGTDLSFLLFPQTFLFLLSFQIFFIQFPLCFDGD